MWLCTCILLTFFGMVISSLLGNSHVTSIIEVNKHSFRRFLGRRYIFQSYGQQIQNLTKRFHRNILKSS